MFTHDSYFIYICSLSKSAFHLSIMVYIYNKDEIGRRSVPTDYPDLFTLEVSMCYGCFLV